MSAGGFEMADVRVGYRKDAPALRDVRAHFAPGRIAAILGPNGAGKSTLLRVMAGALKPWSGRALLEGRDVQRMGLGERAQRIALVAQRPRVAAAFSVREVAALAHIRGQRRREEVQAALALLELETLASTPFAALSVGQQQRVALARALAQLRAAESLRTDGGEGALRGCALLADEPAASMDPRWGLRAFDILRRLAGMGAIVVCALHDLSAARRFADDALVLDAAGVVAAQGACSEVLESPALRDVFGVAFTTLRSSEAVAVVPMASAARAQRRE